MRRHSILFYVLPLLLLTVATARADIAQPKPETPKPPPAKYAVHAGIEVVPDSKAYSARLQISQATVKEIRDAMNSQVSNQSFTDRIAGSSTKTIIAGLLLFMSISFAGVWLARSGSSQKAVAMVLIGFGVMSAAVVITSANAGPPPSIRWRNLSQNLNSGKTTFAEVDIEIVPDGSGVKLIVPTRNAVRPSDD